jgi:N,N'-diacetyllegionaminate synthase
MKKILKENSVFILAEVAQSYEGSIETLIKISKKACGAGVDGVMFQVVFADELAVKDYTHYNLFKSLEMPRSDWTQVIDVIHESGKLVLGEVFGKRSVDLMIDLCVDAFKIHASDLSNIPLLKYIGKIKIPVLLSMGGGYKSEIEEAIRTIQENGTTELILLHGYQACPTEIKDTHIEKMKYIGEVYKLPVGYSDHIAGCVNGDFRNINELAYYLPLLALGAGAKLIEKHIMLDRSKAWEDYESALSTDEFDRFVKLIRTFECSMGEKNLMCNVTEEIYRKGAKKCLVASGKIAVETILTEDKVAFKRIQNPEEGITNLNEVLGKVVLSNLKPDDPILKAILRKNIEKV